MYRKLIYNADLLMTRWWVRGEGEYRFAAGYRRGGLTAELTGKSIDIQVYRPEDVVTFVKDHGITAGIDLMDEELEADIQDLLEAGIYLVDQYIANRDNE